MMNEKLEKAFNDQINAEFYSEYLYLSMLAYFERLNLQGFKNWMDVQRQEYDTGRVWKACRNCHKHH